MSRHVSDQLAGDQAGGDADRCDGPSGSRRLRVLHLITRLDRGGSAENTLLTVAGMDPARFEVHLGVGVTAGARSDTEAVARARGVRFVDVPHLVRAPHPLRDVLALRHLRRLLGDGAYDVVHTHTSKAGLLGRLAAHRARVPAVVHTPHGHVFYGYYGRLLTGLFVRLERLAARRCHRLVALTAADRDDHLRFGVGVDSQWVVVHSGVDFSRLRTGERAPAQVRADLGIEPAAFVVATLGRLTAVKGQADLLRAFARLRAAGGGARLLLIGDGELRGALEKLADDLGIGAATVFAGWRQDVGDVLRACDLFVLPSRNEGMGKALVEAMYVGLPVVATRVGGVPELVHQDRHGLLVPAAEPEALAQAMMRLRGDVDLRRRLGQQAAARAREYGSDSMVARLCELYEALTPAARLTSAGAPVPDASSDERDAVALPR